MTELENCCICLDELELEFLFPCKHNIHITCAYELIIRNYFYIKCPLCRNKLYMDEIYFYTKSLKDYQIEKINETKVLIIQMRIQLLQMYIKSIFKLSNEFKDDISKIHNKLKIYRKIKNKYTINKYAIEKILFLFRKMPF